MRPNLYGGDLTNVVLRQLRLSNATVTLAGDLTLGKNSATLQFLDPGGAGRTITLPAEADSDGLVFVIVNTADAAEILTVQDDAAAAVVTPTQNERAVVFCDGTTWHGFVATEA